MDYYVLYAGLDECYYGQMSAFDIDQFNDVAHAEYAARLRADTIYERNAGDGIILSTDEILENDAYAHDGIWEIANDIFWDLAADWVVYRAELFNINNIEHLELARRLNKEALIRLFKRPKDPSERFKYSIDFWPECSLV